MADEPKTPAAEVIDPTAMRAAFDAALTKSKPSIIEPPKKEVVVSQEPIKTPETLAGEAPAQDEDKDIPTEFKGKDWVKNMRNAHKEAVGKLKILEGQLVDFEGTRNERDDLKARIAEFDAKVSEYKQGQSATALERDPDFRKKYVDGMAQHVSKLESLADVGGLDKDALKAALAQKEPKERVRALDDVVQDAPRYLQGKIIAAIDQIETLEEERAAELKNADESYSLREAERARSERESEERRAKESLDAWNAAQKLAGDYGLDTVAVREAEEFFKNNADIGKAAEAVVKSRAADVLKVKVRELEGELAKYRQASPGIRTGSSHGNEGDANLTFAQRVLKGLNNR